MKLHESTSQSSLDSSNSNLLNEEVTQTILEEEEHGDNIEEKLNQDDNRKDEESDDADCRSEINRSLEESTNRKSSDSLIDSPVLDKASLHADTNPIFREVTVTGGE